MPTFSNISVISTTTYQGKYAYYLGPTYGYVHWNIAFNRWENRSVLGAGILYNYLPSTNFIPTTGSPSPQWVNVVSGFEIFACYVGSCENCELEGEISFDCCFIGEISNYENPDACIPCYCYSFYAKPLTDGVEFTYINCNDEVVNAFVDSDDIMYICARENSITSIEPSEEYIITPSSVLCQSGSVCQPTTTTTTTLAPITTSTTTEAPITTTTTTLACDCIEYFNNTGSTANDISYTDCSTGNPVGPISIPPNQSFCSQGNATGTDVGILSIISFNCCS